MQETAFCRFLNAGIEKVGDTPQLGKSIHSGRRQRHTIGRKRQAADAISDVEHASKQLAGFRVPYFQRVVLIASYNQLAIRRKRNAEDLIFGALERHLLLAAHDIPKPRGRIHAAADKRLVVRRKRQGSDAVLMT